MQNLIDLFKLAQLTRAQVQYGYLLSGLKKQDLSSLAEHHYLVTFIGWQLAMNLKQAGANIDVLKVVEYCMIHDWGELMGGDISVWYAQMNPKAKKLAKAFEEENQRYLASFFGPNEKYFKKLGKEILDYKSDEALIAKVADYMESMTYKVYTKNFREGDDKFTYDKFKQFIKKMKDKVAKHWLEQFIDEWIKTASKTDYISILKKDTKTYSYEYENESS